MRLLVSTPCYGGQLFRNYVGAVHTCFTQARDEGLVSDVHFLWQGSESLIPRARNMDATYLLTEKFDKLLTIDADIDFTYADLKRIITSEKDIVGGIYPLKCFPVVANLNPLPEHRAKYYSSGRGMDYDSLERFSKEIADPETGEAEVEHVPTGFMCVTQKVFATLSHTVKTYFTFQSDTGGVKGFYEFYPCGAREHQYESEDWAFSRLAREAGFRPYINTKVLLGHTGLHTFRMGQFFGAVDAQTK